MPKTGNRTTTPGIYRSRCCKHESTMGTGNKFPPCGYCGNAATWVLVRAANRPTARRKTSKKKSFWDSLFS
jgi:hypothetical protein